MSDAAARPREDGTAGAAALVLLLVWGSNFTVQKQVFEALTPPGFLFARYLIMPACAVLLMLHRHRLRWPAPSARDWGQLASLGLVGHVLHVSLVTYGIHWSTAFSSALIIACGPIFTLAILAVSRVEKLAARQVAGVAIAALGICVFMADKLLQADLRGSRGDLLLLAASVLFSLHTVLAKPAVQRLGAEVVMAYSVLIASVPLVAASAPAALRLDWSAVPFTIWAGLLWAVVVSAFVGWIVWAWINSVRGVARTAPLMYLTPPVAGAIAWFGGGETYGPSKIVGATIALAGVALAQFAGRRT